MTDPGPMPPAIRSSLDLAAWYLARAAADRVKLSAPKLHQLLYLAQALYAATQKGRKLIPATFLAGAEGPLEPTVADALRRGLGNVENCSLEKPLELMLTALWQQYGALPGVALSRMIASDGAWSASLAIAVEAEIPLAAMGGSYRAMLSRQPAAEPEKAAPAAAGKPSDLPPGAVPSGEPTPAIRMTMDGRTVTRWAPKRKIEPADKS